MTEFTPPRPAPWTAPCGPAPALCRATALRASALGDRRVSLDLWRPYRERVGISEQARDAFAAILGMMDEIEAQP